MISSGSKRRGLLHFDLSSLPADAIIATASLNIFVNKLAPGSAGQPVEAYKLTSNWGEGTSNSNGGGQGVAAQTNDATWSTRFTGTPGPWTTAGGDFISSISGSVPISGTGAFSITGSALAADVQSWIANPTSNFGWILTGNEALSQDARRLSSRQSANVAERPTLTITFSILPVTLKAFSAQLQQQNILLKWETVTEIDNNYFGIEHSTNGTRFTEIQRVNGAGNSVLPRSYSFSHLNITSGKHFYRLAQHDFNGAIQYSQVVVIDVNAKKQLLQIVPNPVQTVIGLRANEQLNGSKYQITNSLGQVLISGLLSTQQIGVGNLTKGNYRLTIKKENGEAMSASFIKE